MKKRRIGNNNKGKIPYEVWIHIFLTPQKKKKKKKKKKN